MARTETDIADFDRLICGRGPMPVAVALDAISDPQRASQIPDWIHGFRVHIAENMQLEAILERAQSAQFQIADKGEADRGNFLARLEEAGFERPDLSGFSSAPLQLSSDGQSIVIAFDLSRLEANQPDLDALCGRLTLAGRGRTAQPMLAHRAFNSLDCLPPLVLHRAFDSSKRSGAARQRSGQDPSVSIPLIGEGRGITLRSTR